MKASIFEYKSYKKYLNDLVDHSPQGGRGIKKALAEAIHCQNPFVTRVLNGDYDFSQEQAAASAKYFGLSKSETEFLLLLLNENRAGTDALRNLYLDQIRNKIDQHSLLKSRLKIKATLDREAQATYYSHWKYAAIHMLATIPEFRTRESISKRIGLSLPVVSKVLDFLCSKGLLQKNKNEYIPDTTLLHLERNSPFLPQHHTQWRMKAIDVLDREIHDDLHYSLAFSCSKKDLPRLRERLTKSLEDCSDIIKCSPEETLAVLCFDLFEF